MLIDMTKDGKPEFIYTREHIIMMSNPDLSRKASQYLTTVNDQRSTFLQFKIYERTANDIQT